MTDSDHRNVTHAGTTSTKLDVRVSPGAYFVAAGLATFAAALLLRTDRNGWALIVLAFVFIALPVFAVNDRVAFVGDSIQRVGPIAFILKLLFQYRKRLAISDFETVATHAVRTLRRGGKVRYRYRTQITGKGHDFAIVSGGKNYRRLIRELLPLVHEEKLDTRSRDLRDYLNEPQLVNRKTQLFQLAPSDILDLTKADFKLPPGRVSDNQTPCANDAERAHLLRRLGNELRVLGRLREAGEAFRRALNVTPRAPWTIYDFARLLRSQASAQHDARLLFRARAALRLACLRANDDLVLLRLIGESFLECGDARQAQKVLQKALEIDRGSFKARLGLADVALREGKLAHVIHHYQEAAQTTSEQALARFARREADYYLRLNTDEEYLASELRRINWLESVTRVRRLSARVTTAGMLLALIGGFLDASAASVGWSVASSALLAWMLTLIISRLLLTRSKPRSLA
ncbi:MAG: tetratricopeptide repeat protein [Pyrinomonadaceae bacterium]